MSKPVIPKSKAQDEQTFCHVLVHIQQTRQRAFAQVNTALIELYWSVGKIISEKVYLESWGKGEVKELAAYIAKQDPDIKGFSDKNLWRMKQFFETYQNDKKLSPLVRELSWTHNTIIFSRSKSRAEREYYIKLVQTEKLSKRELERQINAAVFERTQSDPPKISAALRQLHPNAAEIFKDNYTLEFFGLPTRHSESELQKVIIKNLKAFILEIGKDFISIPKTLEDACRRQASDKFIWNEFEPPQAAFGEYLDDTHLPLEQRSTL